MATIKSFTDLSQSKTLSKILPLESADMRIGNYVGKSGKVDGTNIHYFAKGESFGAPEIIDAWSLAALLSLIPEVSLNTFKDGNWNAMIQSEGKMIYADKDNPIDACYKLILKLHELKML